MALRRQVAKRIAFGIVRSTWAKSELVQLAVQYCPWQAHLHRGSVDNCQCRHGLHQSATIRREVRKLSPNGKTKAEVHGQQRLLALPFSSPFSPQSWTRNGQHRSQTKPSRLEAKQPQQLRLPSRMRAPFTLVFSCNRKIMEATVYKVLRHGTSHFRQHLSAVLQHCRCGTLSCSRQHSNRILCEEGYLNAITWRGPQSFPLCSLFHLCALLGCGP